MRIFKTKPYISSISVMIFIMLIFATTVSARDCDPFGLDPFDSTTCGGGDPDSAAPLDEGVLFLIMGGILLGGLKLSRSAADAAQKDARI